MLKRIRYISFFFFFTYLPFSLLFAQIQAKKTPSNLPIICLGVFEDLDKKPEYYKESLLDVSKNQLSTDLTSQGYTVHYDRKKDYDVLIEGEIKAFFDTGRRCSTKFSEIFYPPPNRNCIQGNRSGIIRGSISLYFPKQTPYFETIIHVNLGKKSKDDVNIEDQLCQEFSSIVINKLESILKYSEK
jgi:hypothetical protein